MNTDKKRREAVLECIVQKKNLFSKKFKRKVYQYMGSKLFALGN